MGSFALASACAYVEVVKQQQPSLPMKAVLEIVRHYKEGQQQHQAFGLVDVVQQLRVG